MKKIKLTIFLLSVLVLLSFPKGIHAQTNMVIKADYAYSYDVNALTEEELYELESFDMTLEELFPEEHKDPNDNPVDYGRYLYYHDHLLFRPVPLDNANRISMTSYANKVSRWAAQNPDVDFNIMFIEKDQEIDFATGNNTGSADFFLSQIELPENKKIYYKIHSFSEFDTEFYNTDHHWSHRGAYRGYKLILKALLPDEEPLVPIRELYIGQSKGTKTMSAMTNAFSERWNMYQFEYPEFSYTINGLPEGNYGSQENACRNSINGIYSGQVLYGDVFGWDIKEVVIDRVEDTGNGNILVFGNSYDNPLVKLIASHYDCLYSIDGRLVPTMSIGRYIKDHNISTVLITGDSAHFMYEKFNVID